MKIETIRRRVSNDIFCSSSGFSSKLIDGPECASMRLIVSMRTTFVLLLSAIQPGSAIILSYTRDASANAGGFCTHESDISGAPNNDCFPEPVAFEGYQKLVRFLIITIIIAFSFSISQPVFGMSDIWPGCIGTCETDDTPCLNAKFNIINHSADQQNVLSMKMDINRLHKGCKGSRFPGFEMGESS